MYDDDTQFYKSISQVILKTKNKLQNNYINFCTFEISNSMFNNWLKVNEEKTEFLMAGIGKQSCKVIINSLNVVGINMKYSTSVRNLWIIIDQDLSLKEHVNTMHVQILLFSSEIHHSNKTLPD